MTTAQELREQAAQHERDAYESFQRSDTDGALSQWASGINAERKRLEADLLEDGNLSAFPALFDLEGNLVAAKLIETRFGLAWGFLASDDPFSAFTGFVSAFPKRESTMTKKGYYEGTVITKAKVKVIGKDMVSCRAVIVRADGGFSRDVIIADNGCDVTEVTVVDGGQDS